MLATLASLQFPHIGPVFVQLGPLALRWYGLAYLVGFIFAYACLRILSEGGILRLSKGDLSDLLGWIIVGVIGGGRTGWWLFYHRNDGGPEPWYEPFALWHGGMSFHGGLIGVATVLFVWAWLRKAPLWNLVDCAALIAPIGLFLGRIANFINAELVGRPTVLPWGVVFPGEAFARHPSQIYEALLEGPVLLAVTVWVFRHRGAREGQTAATFLAAYGAFRFIVEFTRQPDPQLGFIAFNWLTMGQLLSAVMVLMGALLYITSGRRWEFLDPAAVALQKP